ncbi:MAG TPA: sulfurtransferase, partial [Candidatus Baltobacteraceae bacterium]|nr:sulfurtransferase [Candidatus Baltobacteraceae bacterium]
DQVYAHLNDAAWVIVDCRHLLQDFDAGRRMYDAAHIPGAFFVSAEDDAAGPKTGTNGRHPLPDPQRFAGFLRELGVNADTQLIAYDAGADMWAARFWYVCRYIGHDAVAVLDGGFAAWTGMGKPITAQPPERPGNGTITPRPRTDLVVDANDVLQSLEGKTFSLIDARGADRFNGKNETVDPVGGHIPGAINRPFRSNYTGPFGQFKRPDELRAEFEAIGIPPQRIVHQCGSGVSAAVNLLGMEIAGMPGTRLYPGSWSEWSADRSRPMVTP